MRPYFAFSLFIFPLILFAQENPQSTVQAKLQDVQPTQNRPPGEDVDSIITNKKMRAETGSKSKYSVSTSIGYAGGSLATPLSDRRPNITNGTGTTDFASMGGSISGRYAMTTQTSVSAGIGARMITPLAGWRKPSDYNGTKYDIDNPGISLQHLYRWAGVQSAFGVSQTLYTTSNMIRQGYVTSFGASQNNIYDLGHSGFTLGVSIYGGVGLFSKRDSNYTNGQADYNFGLAPALEYRVTDNLSLHTDTNLYSYEHIRSTADGLTFRRQARAQNLSFGYSFWRDFFVSAGVSFIINDIRAERATWSMSAAMNWF